MPIPLSLLATPADAGVRMLALSWLQQAALRAEALRDPRRTDDWTLAEFADALRRLDAQLHAGDARLRARVGAAARARLRALARLAEAGADLRRHVGWTGEQLAGLEPRQQPGAAWLLGHLTDLSADIEERLRRELGDAFARFHRRLASRLRIYTVEVELADAAPRPTLSAVIADALQADADILGDRLTEIAASPGARSLRRAERVAARLCYRLELLGGHLPPSQSVLAPCATLREALDALRSRYVLGARLRRTAESEGAARVGRALTHVLRSGTLAGVRGVLVTNTRGGFLALAGRLGGETAGARDALRRHWLGGRAETLLGEVRGVAALLRGPAPRPTPVEREPEREAAWGMDREMERELGRELRGALGREPKRALAAEGGLLPTTA
ncbi:MAG TPA: hypothetical protein VNA89_13610 [Gemmatimonadaceae bacterium]|nr:hypothetical protein [Gemmatimonadaceae bacterium]